MISEVLFKKFSQFIEENKLVQDGETVVLAVSGGPDSLCLFDLFRTIASEKNLNLVVAHLNHCLRPEGAIEAETVRKMAGQHGLPCEVAAVDVALLKKERGIGEEEAGRLARYRHFYEVACRYEAGVVATAHHRDDLAETVLLNIIRGTGVDGLAGILPRRSWRGLRLIRPLLSIRRSEIEEYCRVNHFSPFTDSSNLQPFYKRNKVRLELIPYLEEQYNPAIKESLAGLGELAARDRSLLQPLARQYFKRLARVEKGKIRLHIKKLAALPVALQGRILFYTLKRLVPGGRLSRLHVEQLLQLLKKKKMGLQLTLPERCQAVLGRKELIICRRSGRAISFEPRVLPVPGRLELPGCGIIEASLAAVDGLKWPPQKDQAFLDYELLPTEPLIVRTRRPGDRFYPQGAPGEKKLKDFLIDQKTDASLRDRIPLVTVGDQIIWVTGMRIAHPFRITAQTRQVLLLEYTCNDNIKS